MAKPFEVTDATFQSDVLKSNLPVLVDFWAEWCVACKALAPLVDELAKEYESKLRVGKMDVDSNGNTPSQLGILGLPALVLFKDGKEVERITGKISKNKLFAKIKPHLS